MAAIEKVKVVVLGDSGVGKTSLTYLIAHNKPLLSPGWTVGCSVEVKLHKFKEGTQAQNTFFVELWDVGGSNNHRNTRNVFYQPTHGIILVHDLTNRKSQINLQKWLSEILNQDTANPTFQHVDVDPEQFLGSTQIPILVIGTKFDLAEEKQRKNQYRRLASSIAEQCGADEIFVNCFQARSADMKGFIWDMSTRLIFASGDQRAGSDFAQRISVAVQRGNAASVLGTMPQAFCTTQPTKGGVQKFTNGKKNDSTKSFCFRSFAPGTSNSVKLTRFFDKVIERRYYSRASPFSDKRRIPAYMMSASTPITSNKPTQYLSPRFYHMD